MKRTLRIVVLVAFTVLATASVVSAGGRAEQPAGPRPVVIWSRGGIDDNMQQLAEFREVNPELFERINPTYISAGGNQNEVNSALRLALASGEELPDIVRMNYDTVSEFAEAGVLMDLSPYIEPYLDDLSQAAIELTRYGDQVVAVPFQAKSKLWFYRRDLFAEAGIDPTQIRTPEQFLAAARRYHDVHPDSYFINLGSQPIHYWYFTAFSHWDDARVATDDGEYLITSHPAFSTWLQFTKDLYDSELTFRVDDFSPDWNPGFIDGSIGSWLGASWGWSYPVLRWAEVPNPDQWGVALWPEFVRYGAEGGGGVSVIPAGAPNAEAAAEYLVAQFFETDGAVSYFDSTGVVPTLSSALDVLADRARSAVRPAGMSDAEWYSDPVVFWGETFIEMNRESFEYFQIFPYDPAFSLELAIIRQHTEALLAGDFDTVDEALAAMEADMVQQIGNPYQQ